MSSVVAAVLADRDVRAILGTAPRVVEPGALRLADGSAVAADRVIAAPALVGRRIAGRAGGLRRLRPHPAVRHAWTELDDVYAAGDMTSFPVKQGGLAAQRADAIAAVIARRAGADVPVPRGDVDPPRAALRRAGAALPGGDARRRRAGRCAGRSRVAAESPWWPSGTLVGRHVTPWMAGQALAVA